MRENICIILNSRNKRDALKEMHKTINLFREDHHLDTEFVCNKLFNKKAIEEEYEEFKQKYRDLSEENIERRLIQSGLTNIEEYIDMVLNLYGWETLEKYAKQRYNIIRFEGDDSIGIYNPRGYIDYVDHIVKVKKYKYIKPWEFKKFRISKVVRKDKSDIDWDLDKSYKDNTLILRQDLRRNVKPDDYIAIVRVHY